MDLCLTLKLHEHSLTFFLIIGDIAIFVKFSWLQSRETFRLGFCFLFLFYKDSLETGIQKNLMEILEQEL